MDLVAEYLDPKTLAIASCVSKSWFITMSSDQIWKPICSFHYPSLSTILYHPTVTTVVPYRRLYALGVVSYKRRRLRNPLRPSISLDQLIFAVDIFNVENSDHHIFTLVKDGEHLRINTCTMDRDGEVFRFDVDVTGLTQVEIKFDDMKKMRVTWSIVLKGWRGIFMVMDCNGKEGQSVVEGEKWFSEELPSPGSCWCCGGSSNNNTSSGVMGELGLGFNEGGCGDGSKGLEKVSMGLLSVVNWRYMNVSDALLYLQHFLLPATNM